MKHIQFLILALILAAISLALPVSCTSAPKSTEPEWHTESHHADYLDADISYPQFAGQPEVNRAIRELAQDLYAQFDAEAQDIWLAAKEEFGYTPLPMEFSFDCTTVIQTESYISILAEIYTYETGAAHGYTQLRSLTYDTGKKQFLSITDIGVPLEVLSATCRWALERDLTKTQGTADTQLIADGTTADNLLRAPFTYDGTVLAVYFEQYEVAPYAAGIQSVTIEPKGMTF